MYMERSDSESENNYDEIRSELKGEINHKTEEVIEDDLVICSYCGKRMKERTYKYTHQFICKKKRDNRVEEKSVPKEIKIQIKHRYSHIKII